MIGQFVTSTTSHFLTRISNMNTVLINIIHYGLHYLMPALLALWISKASWTQLNWKRIWLILIATMLVDLDHLLATPIFDPNRCSINFHPLHSWIAIGAYVLLLLPSRTRIVAIGLLFHMFTDGLDCFLRTGSVL